MSAATKTLLAMVAGVVLAVAALAAFVYWLIGGVHFL